MIDNLKKRLRNFLTGPLKWLTLFVLTMTGKKRLVLELIGNLYKSKRYISADRMVYLKFRELRKSLPADLTQSEENLEMRRKFWEQYLMQNYHAPAVVRLAGIYEQLGHIRAAHRLLYLSVDTHTGNDSVLQYFFFFCVRQHYHEDATTLSEFLIDQKHAKLELVRSEILNPTGQNSLLTKSKESSFTREDIEDRERLNNFCEEVSNFFAQLFDRTVNTPGKYPHIVSITFQDITHDNRVKKIASCIGMRGYRSSLICYSDSGKTERGFVGNAAVLKLPVDLNLQGRVRSAMHVGPMHEFISNTVNFNLQILRIRRSEIATRERNQKRTKVRLKILYLILKVGLLKFLLSLSNAIDYLKLFFTNLFNAEERAPYSHLQSDHLDFQEAFGPQIEKLEPDLIHVNDFHLVAVGVTAARNLRKKGIKTKVIYDAHELVEGIHHRYSSLWKSEISHFIDHVDGVVCVSELQAETMKNIYRLEQLPTVVANAPYVAGAISIGPTIKDDLMIDGTLLTYHGWANDSRGVTAIVKALEFLPNDFHIALMVMGVDSYLESLKELERHIRKKLNAENKRLHFLPYVDPKVLSHYLSTSDATLIGLLPAGNVEQSNHHIAMPNKLYESVQAKVPVITSDMPALSAFVNEHKIGSVYKAGSSSGLAESVLDYLGSESDKEQIFNDGLLQLCSWEYQIEQLFNLYEETLGDHLHPKEPVTSIDLEFIPFENFTLPEC
jgi:glycosyltransferase involved in cell wall biosynthesis